ncbi:DUF300 domain-containing protein [Coprinopsis cinerea AmutBmut pab1-1]|nr:DUF300 domain-containing protein [Coprinopsis cinerea AmutBmut pab1-1]
MPCEALHNKVEIDESKFWDENGIHWEPHRIGWAVAGGCTVITVIISTYTVLKHCRNYTNRAQQRQILLIIEYVAATATGNSAHKAIERKDKRPLPIPFCCWRYRPTKAYFMYTVKWSVLQYVIVRPAASITAMICEAFNVLCHAEGFTYKYASVYIECINFVSISIALYGLLVFHGLMSEELKGKRPGAKFLAIKLIVMFTFYQAFVFSWLQGRVIHETKYWTETNIANGLNALAICIEMVFFAILMWWAYTPNEYLRPRDTKPTNVWKALWDSINYSDFAREIAESFRFYFSQVGRSSKSKAKSRSAPTTYSERSMKRRSAWGGGGGDGEERRMDFGEAFGVYRRVSSRGEGEFEMEVGRGGSGSGSSSSGGHDVSGYKGPNTSTQGAPGVYQPAGYSQPPATGYSDPYQKEESKEDGGGGGVDLGYYEHHVVPSVGYQPQGQSESQSRLGGVSRAWRRRVSGTSWRWRI